MIMETDEDDYFLEPEYGYEDLTFLEACMDNDLDAIAAIVDDNPTEEEINERDRCGRVGCKVCGHVCCGRVGCKVCLKADMFVVGG